MTKEQIQAEIDKVQSNKFLPQAVKDLKIKKLKEQLSQAEPAKKETTYNYKGRKIKESELYTEYEDKVTSALENLLDASRSDAQGVAEANAALIEKEYEKGTDAVITAGYIAKKSEKEPKKAKAAKKAPKAAKPAKKSPKDPVLIIRKLIDTLTDIGIDLEGEEETSVAGLRMELEDVRDNDTEKVDELITDYKNDWLDDLSAEPKKEVSAAFATYYKAIGGAPAKKAKKPAKAKVEYKYKGRTIKELTKEDCDELAKEIRERRQKQKKAEKKSKSKPVIEKIAKNVATAVKQAVKNVSASDIKDDPKKELDKMARIEAAAKEFLAKLRGILGEDYDKDAIEGEFKEVHDLIKGLKSKYGK